jgi:hypothetical protein
MSKRKFINALFFYFLELSLVVKLKHLALQTAVAVCMATAGHNAIPFKFSYNPAYTNKTIDAKL